jgi:branched-subunit amino acid transport protein AzlD
MNIWLVIFIAGIGNYLMRCVGAWVNSDRTQAKWLAQVPFAVILVMAIASLVSLIDVGNSDILTTLGALLASIAVIFSNLKKLPLIFSIAIGCVLFGIFNL